MPESLGRVLASLLRIVRLIMCPLLFFMISVGGTLSQGGFNWAQGSYIPFTLAWLMSYAGWASFRRKEMIAETLPASAYVNLKDAFNEVQSRGAKVPSSWLGRIELAVGLTVLYVSMNVTEQGLQMLWLTIGHIVVVVVWRTLSVRFVSSNSNES